MVKGESSEWINKQQFNSWIFRWQEGYGALSYARSQIKVAEYIENQEKHHRKKTFLEEYKQFLDHFEVEYECEIHFQATRISIAPMGQDSVF
jgi:methyltransferase-like protein